MSGSRGKGKRRVPGRDGGAHKKKAAGWRKQAMHAVDDAAQLGEPLAALMYQGQWGQPAAVKIYKFDQKIAKTHLRYHAEYLGWWRGFTIRVLEEHSAKVQALINEIL